METTNDFLDALATRYGASDYKLAKMLGVSGQSTVTNWRHGRSRFDDATCIRVSELLGLDPAYVLTCVAAERTKEPAAAAVWQRVAGALREGVKLSGVAVLAVAIAAGFFAAPSRTYAHSALYGHCANTIYYVKSRLLALWARLWPFSPFGYALA